MPDRSRFQTREWSGPSRNHNIFVPRFGFICHVSGLSRFAAAKGLRISSIETIVKGNCDIRPIYGLGGDSSFQEIFFEIRIEVEESESEVRSFLGNLEERSPIFTTLKKVVKMRGAVFYNGKSLKETETLPAAYLQKN